MTVIMQKLNLPQYPFRIKKEGDKTLIFDAVRRKFVIVTPEEWVRQHFIEYLKREKNYPASLMAVEKKVLVNGLQRRFDLLVYAKTGTPALIAEFKAPSVKITQETFDQAVRYNMALRVKYIVVSNGMQHFACEIDYEINSYRFLPEVPEY